jgi:Mg-chelatase subunit ChlD
LSPTTRLARFACRSVAAVALAALFASAASAQVPLLPEREPNDAATAAQPFEAPVRVFGGLGTKGDVDHFVWVVDDDASAQLFEVVFDGPPGGATVDIASSDAKAVQLTLTTSRSTPSARRNRLLLPPDRYAVTVRGAAGPYALTVHAKALRPLALTTRERARADRVRLVENPAFLLPAGDAWLRWAPGAGRYDIELITMGGAVALTLEDAAGKAVATDTNASIALKGVTLAAGDHWFKLRGPEGAFIVLRLAKADATPTPNDLPNPNDPIYITPGSPVSGRVEAKRDIHHHLRVEGETRLYRLTATGSATKSLIWSSVAGEKLLEARAEKDGAILDHLVLPPGEHRFTVAAGPGDYRLEVTLLPRPASLGKGLLEREPNSGGAFVDDLPFGTAKTGFVTANNDVDIYRFQAAGSVYSRLTVTSQAALELRWTNGGPMQKWSVVANTPLVEHVVVPAGDHELEVVTRGAARGASYTVDLALGDPFDAAYRQGTDAPPSVTARIALTEVPAAFSNVAQTLFGELTLTAKQAATLPLIGITTDPAWSIHFPRGATVDLVAGRATVLPFEVRLVPDLLASPVRLALGVGREGVASGATIDVVPVADLAPVRPSTPLPLPDALLGAIDAARGGAFVDAKGQVRANAGRLAGLIEGTVRRDRRFELRLDAKTTLADMPAIRLRVPTRVVGVTLEAVGPELRTAVKDFAVSLSDDGVTWTEVLVDRLVSREGEQAFVLSAPRAAKYARLEIRSSHAPPGRNGEFPATLGAFKVLADPTAPLTDAAPDLILDTHGGHVVATFPYQGWGANIPFLPDRPAWSVFGFHHARAAAVNELVWEDAPKTSPDQRVPGLTFYGTTLGAAGPWVELGRLTAPGRVKLPAPTWIRFLKVETGTTSKRMRASVPVIRALEHTAGTSVVGSGYRTYRTILGEWGPFARAAHYERLHPETPAPAATTRGHHTRQKAQRLTGEVSGRVQRGQVEDWYSVVVPAGHGLFTLQAKGHPTLDVDFEVQDAKGLVVSPTKIDERAATAVRTFAVEAGQTYYVRVWQPVSSVVFTWDTSGSVAAWVPLVRNAIQRFAETVVPGHERVHLLPFGGGPLLTDWEARDDVLWSALSSYVPAASSESERALRVATELLSETRGTKAVVLLSDALTPRDFGVWEVLAEVRPRVFTAGVASGLEGVGQDRLEAWASVEGGEYVGVTSRGALDGFFARVSARLRLPASYGLSHSTGPRPVVPPGSLEVIDDRPADVGSSVAFVVDVSGSMLELLKGKRRIDIARQILVDTVANDVPAATSVAVRVFGRVGGDPCGTELLVPLGPASAARAALGGIVATKNAMTPIAEALAAVAGDFGDKPGDKTVVLLTDGRETCGGDPKKTLEELEAKGLSLRVNIVGFALSGAAIRRTFIALAEAGGGTFYDADDANLASVLGAAVRADFAVLDGGVVVARGQVGGAPIEVGPGRYRVEVATMPPRVFDDVEVRDGERRKLQLSTGR